MKIFVRCSDCQKSLSVDAENEGKKARCPNCGSVFEIRTHSQATGTDGYGVTAESNPGAADPFLGAAQPATKMSPVNAGELQIPGGARDDVCGWISVAMGAISVVMGIVSIVFTMVCCCFPFGIIGAAIATSAIVTGVFAKNSALKITGIVLGAIGLLVSLAPLILMFVGFARGL